MSSGEKVWKKFGKSEPTMLLSIIKHNIADMGNKRRAPLRVARIEKEEERKVDLRGVMIGAKTDAGIDEYILNQKKIRRKLKRGEAAVELIDKGLLSEGIKLT